MNQLTPLQSEGREANSFSVTTLPLFKPTKRQYLAVYKKMMMMIDEEPE